MEKIISRPINNQVVWDDFIKLNPAASFLQSWQWGEFYRLLDQKIVRLGYYRGSELIGVMLGIVEKAKRATYLTVAGGPLIDFRRKQLVKIWRESLKDATREYDGVFVRVRPQLPDNPENRALFAGHGFRPAPMHLHAQLTNQLDITLPEETLLAKMRKSTRYEIRKSEKINLKLTTTADPEALDGFYGLQLATARRQGFMPFPLPYLKNQFAVFAAAKKALLYSSFFEDTLLAQAFIIFDVNEAVYHYGASTEAGHRYPGASAIQWAAIKEAKKRGLKKYNFWGVAPVNQPDHRFAALSTFKRGFGGIDVAYLPAHDLILNPFKYSLNYLVEKVRKKTRRL
jgi:lipid II:glycine glycyltransferase (peptidoglycan interpeptide bridge formation enzyme)